MSTDAPALRALIVIACLLAIAYVLGDIAQHAIDSAAGSGPETGPAAVQMSSTARVSQAPGPGSPELASGAPPRAVEGHL